MTWLQRLFASALVFMQLMLLGNVLAPAPVFAQERDFCQTSIGGFFGLPTWYKYLNPRYRAAYTDSENNRIPAQCELDPLRTSSGGLDVRYFLKVGMAVFEIVMRVAAMAAIAFVIWGGFQYLMSQGEPEKIAGARTTIVNALVGLMIAIFSVAIVNVVGGAI